MPLALVGFTLQSVPLKNSTVLSSSVVPSWLLIDRPSFQQKASFLNRDRPAGCYYPDGQCDPANKRPKGINPLLSPFTSCAGVTRCRRSILSWVTAPSRGINRVTPTLRLSSHVLDPPCEQGFSALQSIENHLARTASEELVHPF
jgi:hypothetical protein